MLCRPGLTLSFIFESCFECHRYFSHKIRKQRRRLRQWPVVFNSGWYCSAGLSYLYFYHITSQVYLYHLQYLRKKESLNTFKYGSRQPSSQGGSPVLSHQGTSKLLKCFFEKWADMPCCRAGFHRAYRGSAPASSMYSAHTVFVGKSAETHKPLTGTVNAVPCLNSW